MSTRTRKQLSLVGPERRRSHRDDYSYTGCGRARSQRRSEVWRLLHRLGWAWQVPKAQAIERNEEAIAAWCTES
ncbi:helix-turn-helix domain-containing protein [Streptomyces natalensis]|uniref:helix-turn-helix domain-containing protein n=1 Tax=Streptomyces natalensis TaxID=68242 RepID=UPI00099B8D0A